jgi:hypothetical protein
MIGDHWPHTRKITINDCAKLAPGMLHEAFVGNTAVSGRITWPPMPNLSMIAATWRITTWAISATLHLETFIDGRPIADQDFDLRYIKSGWGFVGARGQRIRWLCWPPGGSRWASRDEHGLAHASDAYGGATRVVRRLARIRHTLAEGDWRTHDYRERLEAQAAEAELALLVIAAARIGKRQQQPGRKRKGAPMAPP